MEHPLLEDISELTLDQLTAKLSDLHRKYAYIASRGDARLTNQILMVIEAYQNRYQQKLAETLPKPENDDDDDEYGVLIDIS